MKWNEQQLEVINHKEGACAVIAGAGSGKSSCLVKRIETLVDSGVNQEDILAISFTKNTADELKSKLKKLKINNVNVGTFHAVCIQILAKEGLYKSKLPLQFEVVNEFKKNGNLEKFDMKETMSYIGYQKSYNRTYKDDFIYKNTDMLEEDLRLYFRLYEELKKSKGYMDFDDMLIMCLNFLKDNPNKYTFKYMLVDEHQDSNLVQNELIKLLCPSGNIFCVFDYRQAIYSFRGGNPEYCMNFRNDYHDAKVINLDINYRSCANIVKKANGFIKKYYGDYEFYSDGVPNSSKDGEIKVLSSFERADEASQVADIIQEKIKNGEKLSDICVLYRLNSNSNYIENELKSRDIEYYVDNNGSFFKRKEVEAVMSILRLIHNPHDDEAFSFIFKLGTKPIGFIKHSLLNDMSTMSGSNNMSLYESSRFFRYNSSYQEGNMRRFHECIINLNDQYKKTNNLKTLIDNIIKTFDLKNWIENNFKSQEEIEERNDSLNSLKEFVRNNTLESFINYVYSSNEKKKKTNKNCVSLMSIHKSKGLEYKNVFVVGIQDEKFPHYKSNLDEEARLFYVAITRAKDNLYLSQIGCESTFIEQYK